MSSIKKPHTWLYVAAFAAAFWITFRVVAAAAPATPAPSIQDHVDDPALEQMIADFASAARAQRR